jgi:hypothetical protein
MIEAKELRLGNYVMYNGMVMSVSEILSPKPRKDERYNNKYVVELFDGAGLIDATLDEISGIPLDEDWFYKFKFTVRDKTFSLNYGGESMRYAILETDIRNPFIVYFHGRFGFNMNGGRKNGDYCFNEVHRLQNIYFESTNKELRL